MAVSNNDVNDNNNWMVMKFVFGLLIIIIVYQGCDNYSIQPERKNVKAPSKELTLAKIFEYQNITSIKFSVYDSTCINDKPDKRFRIKYEYYFDLYKSRIITYSDDKPWMVTVDDFKKNISWTYDYNTRRMDTRDEVLRTLFENNAKTYLCTHLKNNIVSKEDEIIQSKECSVFEDENFTTEWVWKNYKIPMQFRRFMNYDNLDQVTTVQLRNIQPNITMADSLFEVPHK